MSFQKLKNHPVLARWFFELTIILKNVKLKSRHNYCSSGCTFVSLRGDSNKKGDCMKRTETTPVLEFHIGELASLLQSYEDPWRIGDLARVFSTETIGGDYSIPAADTGGDLTFNSLEVLRRFSLASCSHQRAFLIALRRALKDHGVQVARVMIGWARNRTRVLTVKSFGDGAQLMISL